MTWDRTSCPLPLPLPYITQTGDQYRLLFYAAPLHTSIHPHRALPPGLFRHSAFGTLRTGVFQITVARCVHRQVRAPRDGPRQPVTPHVFARRRPSFPGSHALLSPPWPSSNLADRIDRLPSTPCRDCPSPLSVPNPANCGCRRRSSPKTRSTTTRPGHHVTTTPPPTAALPSQCNAPGITTPHHI